MFNGSHTIFESTCAIPIAMDSEKIYSKLWRGNKRWKKDIHSFNIRILSSYVKVGNCFELFSFELFWFCNNIWNWWCDDQWMLPDMYEVPCIEHEELMSFQIEWNLYKFKWDIVSRKSRSHTQQTEMKLECIKFSSLY